MKYNQIKIGITISTNESSKIGRVDSLIGIACNGNNDSGITVDLGDKCLNIAPVFQKYEINCGIIYRQRGNDIALNFQNSLKPSSCEEMNHIKQSDEINKNINSFVRYNTRVRSERKEEISKYANISNHFITTARSIEATEKVLFSTDDIFDIELDIATKYYMKCINNEHKISSYSINFNHYSYIINQTNMLIFHLMIWV